MEIFNGNIRNFAKYLEEKSIANFDEWNEDTQFDTVNLAELIHPFIHQLIDRLLSIDWDIDKLSDTDASFIVSSLRFILQCEAKGLSDAGYRMTEINEKLISNIPLTLTLFSK